ncbi:MAG TPA: beta-ketoacyl-ACP synthase 3 [Solirubrobacteraceae bacterium]|nr:beta-ketoacyl-ACP synthase 3 [Solirubrobacteraceae bacterium]
MVLLDSAALSAPAARHALPLGRGAAATSVGISLPSRVVSSAEIEARLGLAPDWIERRTGIRNRRIAAPEERLQTHAAAAARQALDRAGVSATDVDLVVVATSTADEVMPAAAPLVAHEIGAFGAGAFDVGAACNGFLSALAVGAAQVETGRARTALVVGADFMSRVLDLDDRSTAAVFGDGAGAVLLEAIEGPSRLGPVVLGADAEGAGHIEIPRVDQWIRMRGHETYREAVAHLSLATEQAVGAAGLRLQEIDLFVYHQANGRILTAVGERLGLDPARVVDCIAEYGNTSAATLPLALDHAASHGLLHDGSRVLLGAFGAGFTWGAAVLEWGAA